MKLEPGRVIDCDDVFIDFIRLSLNPIYLRSRSNTTPTPTKEIYEPPFDILQLIAGIPFYLWVAIWALVIVAVIENLR